MAELTPDQIKLEQERLELLQKQNEAVKDLTAAYNALGKIKGKLSDSDKEAINLAKTLTGISGNIEKSINKRLSGSATAKDLSKQLNQLEQDKILLANKSAAIDAKITADRAAALSAARQKAQEENKLKRELQNIDEQITQAEIARQVHLQNGNAGLAKQAADEVKALQYNAKLKEKKIQDVIKEKEAQKELIKALDEEKAAHEKIKKQLDEEIALIKEAKKQKQQEEVLDVLKEKFRAKEIKEMFTIAGLLKIMLDAALKFNEISVQTGKSLGYGADQADRVTTNLVDIAQHSSNLNVTLKNLGEAMDQLNAAMGGVAEYSADALETQVMLTKQFGLTGDEAAGIYKFATLSGKASSQINDEMVGAFVATRNAVKGSADFKATMAEVAKVSGQLAVNFKNNPAEITKAVVQAQALGTTLEKAKNQGAALLNFESSIEEELKAELLTGQAMNLERARAAALQGDQVTVMKELANQGMTLNKFQNMNVIAQESYAKAIGLSADELSEQLRKQKIAQEQGKSLAEITKEEELEAEKRQNIQDKFNTAIDKLKDFFGNLVAGPVGQFLEMLTSSLDLITSIGAGLATWYATSKLIAGTQMLITWYSKQKLIADRLGVGVGNVMLAQLGRMLGISTAKAVADTTSATALSFGALLPVILGAGVAIYSLLSSFKTADDMVQPGYGKRTILSPEGAIALNDKDTVIAGTNLGGGKGETISPTIDLTPMIAAINQVKASVDRLYTKDSTINMDGKKVGTTLSQGSHKVA